MKPPEARHPLKQGAYKAVLLNTVVDHFEKEQKAREDSQTGFSTESPVAFPLSDSTEDPRWDAETQLVAAYHPEKRHRSPRRTLLGALGVAAALGLSLTSQQSEGTQTAAAGDAVEESTVEEEVRQRWERGEVTVVFDSSIDELGPGIRDRIRDAFATWETTGASLPTIEFAEGSGAVAALEPDGQSTVLVAPIEFEGHESDLAITIGFSHPTTGEVSEADIVINQKHLFAAVERAETLRSGELTDSMSHPEDHESCTGSLDARACGESYDLENVLAHEVGHFFGLGENYDDTRATMFSCTSACEIHKRDLEPVDVDSIVQLYSNVPEELPASCAGVQMSRGPAPTKTGWWIGWVALGCCFLLRRRITRPTTSR